MPLKVEDIARLAGKHAFDEYDRNLGVLVSFYSDVDGNVEAVEIKVADKGVEHVAADRVKITDGKLVVTPIWKYDAVKVIEALDRAYRRRRALETLSQQGDLPGDVIKPMRLKLESQIKELRRRAEEVKREVQRRISEIDDELLRVARAIANLQMLYFSNEIEDKGYTQAIDQLRKLRESLSAEKADAKKVLEKLEKTMEAATVQAPAAKHVPAHTPATTPPSTSTSAHGVKAPGADKVIVKVED
ncbi:CdvA-like protein [Stetteria hydrogenophila]